MQNGCGSVFRGIAFVAEERAAREQRAGDWRQVRRFQQRALVPEQGEGTGTELAVAQPEVMEQHHALRGTQGGTPSGVKH